MPAHLRGAVGPTLTWIAVAAVIACLSVGSDARGMLQAGPSALNGVTSRFSVEETSGPAARASDPVSGRSFGVFLTVHGVRAGARAPRFRVHVPDAMLTPTGTQVARTLGLLWAVADARFGVLNARLKNGCPDVWLCRDGEAGGEQTREHLFIYDALSSRSSVEWLRTVAHEYGHYLLPGPAGYTAPEAWANGLLGERMFIKWLNEDLASGRLGDHGIGWIAAEGVRDYCDRQVAPLVERVLRNGPDRALIAGTGKASMDEALGLLLYADSVQGSTVLPRMLEWLPSRAARMPTGVALLEAYERLMADQSHVVYRVPAGAPAWLYVPAGRLEARSDPPGIASLTIGSHRAAVRDGAGAVTVSKAGWRDVRLQTRAVGSDGCVILHLTQTVPR